jgi:glucan endo-1,3-alpha-glucosidase
MGSGQNWYRIGEDNFPQRLEQVLQLQPDFVEVITWNDAGESHYVGNIWPEQTACCSDIQAYADGFDHSGWQQVLKPFIAAYKSGATDASSISPISGSTEGAMWYRTLLTSARCSSTITNYQQAVDAINFAIILPESASGYSINIYSNENLLQTVPGQPGLNGGSIPGMQAGPANTQKIEITDSSGTVVASAIGTKDVLPESTSAVCNWNYEVVGISTQSSPAPSSSSSPSCQLGLSKRS